MSVYQVLVVDDSAFMRKIITDLIQQDPSFRVADTAATGVEAVEKARRLHPDLITMDVEMPELNGLDALKIIMSEQPIPIIMLSGINETGLKETIKALEAGAFDFIRKPSIQFRQDIYEVGNELRNQMKEAVQMMERRARRAAEKDEAAARTASSGEEPSTSARTKNRDAVVHHKLPDKTIAQESKSAHPETASKNIPAPRSAKSKLDDIKSITQRLAQELETAKKETEKKTRSKSSRADKEPAKLSSDVIKTEQESLAQVKAAKTKKPKKADSSSKPSGSFSKLVAIGCSTGGPRALKTLLSHFPGDFEAPIVIVQHMPPDFTRSLAARLDSFSEIHVVEAAHGMILKAGTAYIAPGGYHMRVRENVNSDYEIELGSEDPVNGHRPSVDTLFESLLPFDALERHIAILTGMGSDGARMMKRLFEAGVTSTFAENEETCVVYGMPRAAAELGCVNQLLPLEELAERLVKAVTRNG
ncbi:MULTISPECIES: chemotaxis response regulator protein-glutamate methylesterase [unclassified Paenibacillus]|uniref:Protein-glutamate methylesterase/protein-glutamine glutaminase n=1 Tax=Paenibacillus provencensis TaxID=441151 RepID=A0ABW3PX17_9BACL|nr:MULTISPECIES: chemotaxis response regulator protein-glutamate methylesterase [unclassified Paenibacillus]MCM3128733.1 chemotaxis response regulator protein-glutamate methylesterase [Paenibacillus sp. MER 78]SFS48155.1 two-component system, chemotaxis family, response regulator CheB [Paenibacillus sp. 453mf]